MKAVEKTVFYCDHCRKHGLSRYAMGNHEQRCTMNPKRVCRWGGKHELNLPYLYGAMQERAPLAQSDIDWLRDEVDGCPACMLAALRQSGVEFHFDPQGGNIFHYDDEVARVRAEEREFAHGDVW